MRVRKEKLDMIICTASYFICVIRTGAFSVAAFTHTLLCELKPCLFLFLLTLFISECKLIFLQCVGCGTEGTVSVSGGVALAMCQPLAVSQSVGPFTLD